MGLFRDVQNAKFLRQQLLEGNGEYEYAFIDADVVSIGFIFEAWVGQRKEKNKAHKELRRGWGQIGIFEADLIMVLWSPLDCLYDPCVGWRIQGCK